MFYGFHPGHFGFNDQIFHQKSETKMGPWIRMDLCVLWLSWFGWFALVKTRKKRGKPLVLKHNLFGVGSDFNLRLETFRFHVFVIRHEKNGHPEFEQSTCSPGPEIFIHIHIPIYSWLEYQSIHLTPRNSIVFIRLQCCEDSLTIAKNVTVM